MKLFITLSIASFVIIGALCQGGLGGYGDHGGHGGGSIHHGIIGLSRGVELEHHHGGGNEGGDGGEGGHEHKEEHKKESHYGIGWGGSKFQTPVDVHHEEEVHLKAHPEFHYAYKVADHKTKDYHSQQETRNGYKVKGSYSLLEPDHKTIRVVDYESDKKQGFIAKVSYKKHN